MAKPNVFVSSTYYDLKYIREALKNFIESYGYQATLNEYGGVVYKHGDELDDSCFDEVKNSDMLVLIIGGRYGSPISDEIDSQKKLYFYDEYTSITSQEFRTAYEAHIPTYIFIEKSVNNEYYTYSKNKSNSTLKYAHADSINVYKFIDEIKNSFSSTIIFDFEKFDDIEIILREQWAGLFSEYLKSLRNRNEDNVVVSSINKLEIVSENISEIVNQLGKKILSDDINEIINNQNYKLIEFYTNEIFERVFLDFSREIDISESKKLMNIVNDVLFQNKTVHNIFKKSYRNIGEEEEEEDIIPNFVDLAWDEIQSRIENELSNSIYFHSDNIKTICSIYVQKIVPIFEADRSQFDRFMNLSAMYIRDMSSRNIV